MLAEEEQEQEGVEVFQQQAKGQGPEAQRENQPSVPLPFFQRDAGV